MFGSMFALRILSRKFEFRGSEERAALDRIVDATFPSVLQLLQVQYSFSKQALSVLGRYSKT